MATWPPETAPARGPESPGGPGRAGRGSRFLELGAGVRAIGKSSRNPRLEVVFCGSPRGILKEC